MSEFCMPSLGSDMEDGTLIEWEKQPGDTVNRGDVIAVVETQKGAIEVEVYEDGVLEKVLVNLGDKLPVGTPLAIIGDGSGSSSMSRNAVSEPLAQTISSNKDSNKSIDIDSVSIADAVAIADTGEKNQPVTATVAQNRVRATPAAKKLALDSNIDLVSLSGSGPDSAIVLDDVKSAIRTSVSGESVPLRESSSESGNAPDVSKSEVATKRTAMDGMRAAIAAAMSRSKREIPHFYLSHTVQLDKLMAFVSEKNAQRIPEHRLAYGALYIKAVALAVSKYPEFNGHYKEEKYIASKAIHIGMAINIRGGGLVAPAIHHCDSLGIDDTMEKLKDLVARVRNGRFKAAEISDPTLTISSLGDRGVDSLYGVIFPPQVAIIGIGTPGSTVQIVDGSIEPIHTVTITLAADHRVCDGHRGSLFLRDIGRYLNEPDKLQ